MTKENESIKRPKLIGAHFSIAKGLHSAIKEAINLGCDTLQIFTKNATTWREKVLKEKEINEFKKTAVQAGITEIVSHTSYLINIASPDPENYEKSKNALAAEIERCELLGIPLVVLHPGSHMGRGETEGMDRIADAVKDVFGRVKHKNTRLLLEITAGQGTALGCTFEQLAIMLDKIDSPQRTGICFDTCHAFAAGYDLRTRQAYENTWKELDDIIGIENLFAIHLNDSKKGLGSKIDRHEHIGKGQLGLHAFDMIMNDPRFFLIPKILETPKKINSEDADPQNLDVLRRLFRAGYE